MLFALFWVCVGIVIGWNWPQPPWAHDIQDKIVSIFRGGSPRT
jgi:hypothetical protein